MVDRLQVVVLLRIAEGRGADFEAHERRAVEFMARHGGRLERRIACDADAGGPDEVHLLSFPDRAAFEAYRRDADVVALSAARKDAIARTEIISGREVPAFAPAVSDELRIVGLDHVYLAVRDMTRSEPFYDRAMEALGFRKGDKAIAGERHAHYFNPFLQVSIRPARTDEPHDPYRAGLHHLCLQAADVAGVDAAHARLSALGVGATAPRKYPEYNPDYYATFFEDPDGIRFEVVARTPHRENVARRWHDFRTFLNPVQELLARESKKA